MKDAIMKQAFSLLVLFMISTLLLSVGGIASAKNVEKETKIDPPDQLIRTITTDVMNTIKQDPALRNGDLKKITQLVDQKILPHANMAHTTRLVLGRHWKKATAKQQQQLVTQFKDLLFYTYAGAVAYIDNQKVSYKPFIASPNATDVVVQTEVIHQGKPYAVNYRLEKTTSGWKVYDVAIGGVWQVLTFREQFNDYVSEHGIVGLLSYLTEQNQRRAASWQP
jgi:phospholipid transport system substrate-binding protein